MQQMNVDKMLGSISAKRFSEWQAFDQLEPIGDRRGDMQAAVIAQTLANIFCAVKGKPPYTLQDFLVVTDKKAAPRPKQSWQEQKRMLTYFAMQHNAAVVATKGRKAE